MFSVKFIMFGMICALLAVVLYASAPVLTLIFGLFALAMLGGAVWTLVRTRRMAARGDEPEDAEQPAAEQIPLPAESPLRADELIWRFQRERGAHLEGTQDDSGANWLLLQEGRSLRETVEAFVAAKEAAEAENRAYFLLPNRKKVWLDAPTMLRVPKEREAEAQKTDWDAIIQICKAQSLRVVVEDEDYRLRELTQGYRYRLDLEERENDSGAAFGMVKLVPDGN
ncbi:MAG: hypothetical protein IJR65_04880 [Oscillospiraceae bacterium]|nr:hypothetical protein [Oscillospiraceae bacterium]